jgi:citrate lyase subunit beta / citryl-CoA lyase
VQVREHRAARRADRGDDVAAAEASPADAVVLDLKDGVAAQKSAVARAAVAHRLQSRRPVWVRISDTTTDDWALDLDLLAAAPPRAVAGVVLAKAEAGGRVQATAARLPDGTPVVALIETAVGLDNAREIARPAATLRLAFGSGDFCRDAGITADPLSLAFARSQLVIASRVARIAPPIDGPTIVRDNVLRSATATACAAGMTGKLCLHSDEAAVINAALSPSADEMSWAREAIARLGEDGAHVQQSSDRPMLQRALHIREQALTFRR